MKISTGTDQVVLETSLSQAELWPSSLKTKLERRGCSEQGLWMYRKKDVEDRK